MDRELETKGRIRSDEAGKGERAAGIEGCADRRRVQAQAIEEREEEGARACKRANNEDLVCGRIGPMNDQLGIRVFSRQAQDSGASESVRGNMPPAWPHGIGSESW